MGTDPLVQSVRRHLAPGRLLPLGEAADGAWLAERAAAGVLRHVMDGMPGVRPGALRIALSDPGTAGRPAVPAPPSALPPGPVRIEAEFEAAVDRPLPVTAERVRAALTEAADDRLGLVVAAVDLRISGLLEKPEDARSRESTSEAESQAAVPAGSGPADGGDDTGAAAAGGTDSAVRTAALGVPGVARLTPAPYGGDRPVWIKDALPDGRGDTPPGRHVEIHLAVFADHRVLDVVRRVRSAAARAAAGGAPGQVTVAVVVPQVADTART